MIKSSHFANYFIWNITHGRFLNLKESCQPKTEKENTLKDFCWAKGLAKRDEFLEEGLRQNLEQKENEKLKICNLLRTSKSRKKKIELRKICQEKLAEGIANPKASQEKLESENYEEIRRMKIEATRGNIPVKTTARKTTSPSPRTRAIKMTKEGQNSLWCQEWRENWV